VKYWKILLIIVFFIIAIALGWFARSSLLKESDVNIVKNIIPDKTLEKYAIENLDGDLIKTGELIISEKLSDHEIYESSKFEFEFDPEINSRETKKTTGMINIPKTDIPMPVVLMLRGYVDPTIYQTGTGSKNAAYYFAENGFITLAPDFLGYAGSDIESSDIFEARFQTYVTAISLYKSINQIDKWDGKNIFIWAHSNGGQIALVLLESVGRSIPTSLWAPVTKPFPYSILYYTDESEDRGKFIRKKLAAFEENYDVEKYSADNYLDKIISPLTVHQGLKDDAVPLEWTRDFVKRYQETDQEINLYEYAQADHNMRPNWDEVIYTDLTFFRSFVTLP
jgi:dipeptidyl aminopeptidase/acylaminoacyl peptidase